MKKMFFTLAAVAAMLAACNNDENIPLVDKLTDTPISINAGVAELNSRAGHDAGALTNGEMGFFLTTEGTDATDLRYNATNETMVYDAVKGWVSKGGQTLLWKNTTAEVSYIAYHPYNATTDVTGKTTTVITPEIQTNDNVVDFLFAAGSTTGQQSPDGIALNLMHQMTKLIVTLRAGTELGTTPQFKQVILKDMKKEETFNLETGEWKNDAVSTVAITMIENDNLNYEAIVIPQEFKDSKFMVEITTDDNRTFVFKHNTVVLEKGKAYTLNLVIGKDKVELDNAGITAKDWGVPDSWNGSFETE